MRTLVWGVKGVRGMEREGGVVRGRGRQAKEAVVLTMMRNDDDDDYDDTRLNKKKIQIFQIFFFECRK
jgi:hypothetical protein